ncbi:DNA repair protein SWI5 homolog [Boleophthalmus pectinirostris]|uniref:DNA repair protein SWI5 homolog n=1 Tax=Boleophthalmus pectinirostris TaxID=150288 RepID=UPI000A1C2735|nr:DNA repair protein SWI5 homolog [Boleophthalmus pectinirostris]
MDTGQSTENHSSITKTHSSTPKGNELRKEVQGRTPCSKFKKVHSNFKSPLQVPRSAKVSPEEEVSELQRRREQLDSEIALLEAEGCNVEELEQHIDKLHEYNDIKDTGQLLLGRIAALRGTTTRDLYTHFGLDLDD